MKKLLFVILLCITTTFVARAQTKEETITWLKEKLQKYIQYKYYSWSAENITVDVTECFITVKYTLLEPEGDGGKKYYRQYYYIPTSGVEFSPNYPIRMKDDIKSIRKNRNNIENGEEELTYWTQLQVIQGEEKLSERLQKAVDHLATFCPKKKETF